MEQTPMVSIIVPVYNVAPYLRQCMDSLINQTYRNIEIICVNDGATDESGAILAEYAAKDSTIKVISQKNAGLSAARNVGFSFATGDYVMYVDSDDWIDLETCETAVAIAVKHKADIVFWPYIRESQNAQRPKTLFYDDCNGVQREHNKKLNNGLPILHKVPPKRDYGRYFCIMAEKGGTSHGGLTEKLSPFFHAKKQEVNAYGR